MLAVTMLKTYAFEKVTSHIREVMDQPTVIELRDTAGGEAQFLKLWTLLPDQLP
jgi:hypothetical protein